MKQPSVYLKMRVLGAVDTVEGRVPYLALIALWAEMLPNCQPNGRRLLHRECGKGGLPGILTPLPAPGAFS